MQDQVMLNQTCVIWPKVIKVIAMIFMIGFMDLNNKSNKSVCEVQVGRVHGAGLAARHLADYTVWTV